MDERTLEKLTAGLLQAATPRDHTPAWPKACLDLLQDAGLWRCAIPTRWGGAAAPYPQHVRAYESVAAGSLAAALLLTQRDGAVDLIARGKNPELKDRLLPAHARGERFTSIGISQVTTSVGGRAPKLLATVCDEGFILDGVMPWVSGACGCDEIVTAAVTSDGLELLACVPTAARGLTCEPAMRLMALESSCTSRVRCEHVVITQAEIVRGPAARVLSRRTPVKELTVTAVGLGSAAAMAGELRKSGESLEATARGFVEELFGELDELRSAIYAAAERLGEDETSAQSVALRVRMNHLLSRLALAMLSAGKGSGYVLGSPSERLLREAMFFQVWSCPDTVRTRTLERLIRGGSATESAGGGAAS